MKNLLFLLPFLFLSCDLDDSSGVEGENLDTSLQFHVISKNTESQQLYFTYIDTNTEEKISSNLTQEIGLPVEALRAFSKNNQISWYQLQNGNFNVWQKNASSQMSQTIEAPCEIVDENLQVVSNTENEVLFFTRFFGSSNVPSESRIRIYSGDQNCQYLSFKDTSIISTYTYGSTLLIQALNIFNSEDIKVIKINTTTGQIEGEIEIRQGARMTIEGNKLHVFYLDHIYSIYSLNSFEELATTNFTLISESNGGFFYSAFKEDTMLINVPYAQPSLIGQGPAIVNLTSNEITSPYSVLFTIQDSLRQIEGYEGASIGVYDVDIETGHIVCGFSNYVTSFEYGVVITNFEGTIDQVINLDQQVTELLIK